MDSTLIQFIRNCKVFASLGLEDNVIEALATEFTRITIPANEYVFSQNDPSSHFYILEQGHLLAYLSLPNAKPKLVGEIFPGETVGELGALSGEPRTLSLKAAENCSLLEMPSATFKKLCQQYPAILFETIYPLVNRSQQIIRILSSADTKKHIAIIPADEKVDIVDFEEKIRFALSHYKKITLISENTVHSDNKEISINVERMLVEAEENNHVILYLLKSYETPLAASCWDKIGKLYIVGNGNSQPYLGEFALKKLNDTKNLIEVRRELILLYKDNVPPFNTHSWLEKSNFFLHHHVRLHLPSDFQRLIRFIRGKAIGLVLGGGGTKGWAEIGALKALIEHKVPIDAIGGASIGAMISGLYAINESYEDTAALFEDLITATVGTISWRNLCWPSASLFSAETFTKELQKVFDSLRIENMRIPYFCISTNLGQFKEEQHYSGLMWEKIRASVSIPGLVPPMVINGELHLDGGLVNNLPVNRMREMLGPEGKIVAVELLSHPNQHLKYSFPPTLTPSETFLAKFKIAYREYRFPSFIDTFLRSLLVGSSLKQKENSAAADILINPNTTTFSMISLRKNDRVNLFELGYKQASEKLENWRPKKNKVPIKAP